jgi:spore cortex formation protein SpoVR/YcgB (stage V sporulation)
MRNFKDESFIAQYLSPAADARIPLFSVLDDDRQDKLKDDAIHDEPGYRRCAASWPSNTTSAAATPTSRCGTSTCAATAR